MKKSTELTIRKPDDFHCHFRDTIYIERTVPDCTRQFARAIAMPNLKPPVTTVDAALAYKARLQSQLSKQGDFTPLMTLYLTDSTSAEQVVEAKNSGEISAFKLYPAGATTNSAKGVQNLNNLYPVLAEMQRVDMPLLIHGESTDPEVDVFGREAVFIDEHLAPIVAEFPNLRIVLEHISTEQAVRFVEQAPSTVAATITAHHLLLNRNALFEGGLRPHHYCLPILKAKQHQQALQQAAISGNPKFFLGTDSAPHATGQKESACGCAGIYTSHAAMEIYATVFEQLGALDKLEDFASRFGAEFHGLPLNQGSITLEKQSWQVPDTLSFGDSALKPLLSGQQLHWKLRDE